MGLVSASRRALPAAPRSFTTLLIPLLSRCFPRGLLDYWRLFLRAGSLGPNGYLGPFPCSGCVAGPAADSAVGSVIPPQGWQPLHSGSTSLHCSRASWGLRTTSSLPPSKDVSEQIRLRLCSWGLAAWDQPCSAGRASFFLAGCGSRDQELPAASGVNKPCRAGSI